MLGPIDELSDPLNFNFPTIQKPVNRFTMGIN